MTSAVRGVGGLSSADIFSDKGGRGSSDAYVCIFGAKVLRLFEIYVVSVIRKDKGGQFFAILDGR